MLLVIGTRDAAGQQQPWMQVNASSDSSTTDTSLRLLRHINYRTLAPKPIMGHPFVTEKRLFITKDDHENLGIPGDSLTQEQILNRMARIYRYQADLLAAQARGDVESTETLLDISMSALSILVDLPSVANDPKFTELYRTVVTEYEQYYGFSDSLFIQQGDIYNIRDMAFAQLNENGQAPFDSITLPEFSFADTDIPMTINERVKSSMVFLLAKPDEHLYHWLSRAETYFPMIEKIFEEEGVPDELKYLAMIESGLNPRAKSWARAVGMWQFIKATGKAYDLNSNGWIDERMNPEKATRAAARHLRDLHRMFGDWQLALAGYNYSPGRLRRHIRRAEARLGRKATYWDVYDRLPRETRNYVPMFIATAIIASNPRAFDIINPLAAGSAYEFDYVPVQGMLSLQEVADMSGTDLKTIKALNPELRGNHLPPSQTAYYVRIPLHSYDRFAEAYSGLPVQEKVTASHHRVRSGETLGQIARRYGVSVSSLMRKNGLHSSVIRIGQSLVVPTTSYASGVDLADATPLRIRYGMRSIRPISAAGTTVLDTNLLLARAEERRIAETPVVQASVTDKPASKEIAQKTNQAKTSSGQTTQQPSSRVVYRVRKGDTLIDIAKKFRVSVSELRKWNNISSNLIRIGQRLTVYPKSSS